MNILFYINELSGGGAERVIANLANHFSDIGNNVTICTTYETPNEYLVNNKVRRIVLDDESNKKSNRIVKNIRRLSKLHKAIKDEDADVIVSFMFEPNYRSIISSFGTKVKKIISVRNDPSIEYSGFIGNTVANFLLPMADGCVFQTEEAKSYFPIKLQNKSRIILNDVNDDFFNAKREPIKGKIVTLGRLTPQKNHEMLIKAFSEIADKHNDSILEIYGNGELKESLEKIIEEYGLENRVFIKEYTSNVKSVLESAEIFVLSSNYEGMPNSLKEALTVDVPCISTDCPCGGPRTLIQNGKNGILIPVGDYNVLAKQLDNLLCNEELKESLSKNAKIMSNRYRKEVVFEQWKQYIYDVVNS